uniref:Uncharacterized protein n=1 Tax=Anopheles culicifacies TaxID=139723 RepID=A0A182MAS7_9DIPT
KPQPKKGSDKPESKNKKPNEDAKASKEPEDKQDDSNADSSEDELDEDSNDPKQSPKSGKEPSKADKDSSNPQPKKGSDKPGSKNKKPNEDAKASKEPEVQQKDNKKSPASRTVPAESSLTDLYPTPPFEAEASLSGIGSPSDSNDVLGAISRVLPVNRGTVASLAASGATDKPSMTPKTAPSSSTDIDMYDEVDDEDTDSINTGMPDKQQVSDPEKANQSAPQPSDTGNCIEIVLKVPTDARHVIVRTENAKFKSEDGVSLNELVNKIAPGVYDVQLAKFDKVVFEKYDRPQSAAEPEAPTNLGKAFNYDELVPKPRNSVPNAQVPGDSINAYLPKVGSRVDVTPEKKGKSARDKNEPTNQRRIPDRFLAMGRRG